MQNSKPEMKRRIITVYEQLEFGTRLPDMFTKAGSETSVRTFDLSSIEDCIEIQRFHCFGRWGGRYQVHAWAIFRYSMQLVQVQIDSSPG